MSDTVDFALDRLTDWPRFESLASARVERSFSGSGARPRVAFQFSLRQDVGQKTKETTLGV